MNRDKFKLFTVGPVEMPAEIMLMGSDKLPYFRTREFSQINLEIARLLKKFVGTEQSSEVVILTASGTGAMEAAVINTFNANDKVLVISGGSFGDRFVQICKIHGINYSVLRLPHGKTLEPEVLDNYRGKGYTGLLINAHETSTGVYYNLPMIGEFCKSEGICLVVDAISSFLADPYYMDKWNIDITIISSQKALALPPGLSSLIINHKTAERIKTNKVNSLYFNIPEYFINMDRGQTPFTPAVGIILQMAARLNQINLKGVDKLIEQTAVLAKNFREKVRELPFIITADKLSNALTPLKPQKEINTYDIFLHLQERYKIVICPNGGDLSDNFRVGHIGKLEISDNEALINALKEMEREGII